MFRSIVHPGSILKDKLDELGITPRAFARQMDLPTNCASRIISSKRSISGYTGLFFGRWFGVNPKFRTNLQSQFESATADKETGETIRKLTKELSRPPVAEQPRGRTNGKARESGIVPLEADVEGRDRLS